jgi:hypothetical protein
LFVSFTKAWNPLNHTNLNTILLKVSRIWTPDLYLINTADKSGYFISNDNMAFVLSNGLVILNAGIHCKENTHIFYKTLCFKNLEREIFNFQK